MLDTKVRSATAERIRALAEQHHIAYERTATDELGQHITRLADDDAQLDDTELLLLALERAGRITERAAVRLHADYLHEIAQ